MVIHSLDAFEVLSEFEDPRTDLFNFFEWLRDLKVTSMLISESSSPLSVLEAPRATSDIEFLADGVIQLTMEKTDQINFKRCIRCVKMRSAKHSPDRFTMVFEQSQFEVTKTIY